VTVSAEEPQLSQGRWIARTSLVDYSHIVYLLMAAVLLAHGALFGAALIHLLLAAGLVVLHRGLGERNGWKRVHQLYPIILLPYFYGELGTLNHIASGTFYDSTVQGWEAALFGRSPALWLSEKLPFLPFSELLHVCYMIYYLLFPWLGIYLLRKGRTRDFQIACWTALSCYLINLAITIFFPVKGPRPIYPDLDTSLQGPVWTFVHHSVMKKAADGAAFPSAHVSLSVVTALIAYRYARPLFGPLTVMAVFITTATMYCRFHYASDVTGGILLAVVAAWVGPWSFNKLAPSEP
jgi:membrane-associated phospholipid phosphatase